MAKILFVEDDVDLSNRITSLLKEQHHHVEECRTGESATDLLRLSAYDLVILDWDLPGVKGIDVLREFRNGGGITPVLMLTGHDDLDDIERGLQTGADDYLTKPFAMRELSARVLALTRRTSKTYDNVLKTKTLQVDLKNHTVTKDSQEVKLQPQEFRLLEFLLRNSDQIFNVDSLLQRVWSTDTEASADTVRVCVTRLRNKIDTPGKSSIIRTIHRLGYQIDLDQ